MSNAKKTKCKTCKKLVPKTSTYCPNCGTRLQGEGASIITSETVDKLASEGMEAIVEVIKYFKEKERHEFEIRSKYEFQKGILLTIVGSLMAIIIVCSVILAQAGYLDSGAFTFLMGTIIGSFIALLGDFLFGIRHTKT